MRYPFTLFPLAILFVVSPSLAAPEDKVAPSLCESGEENLFACVTAKKKLIAICASKTGSAEAGYVQYRFGQPNQIEITVPKDRATPPKGIIGYYHLVYAGGGGTAVRFKGGEFDYVVYSGVGRGWEKHGVAVEKNGKRSANITCPKESTGILSIKWLRQRGVEEWKEFEIP